jgi:hypothetical protein
MYPFQVYVFEVQSTMGNLPVLLSKTYVISLCGVLVDMQAGRVELQYPRAQVYHMVQVERMVSTACEALGISHGSHCLFPAAAMLLHHSFLLTCSSLHQG